MVWADIYFYGVAELIATSAKHNYTLYCNTLGCGLVPFVADVLGYKNIWVYYQDNAPIHTSGETRKWLSKRYLTTLPWTRTHQTSIDVRTTGVCLLEQFTSTGGNV